MDRGSGLVYDLNKATDMGSYDTNAYAQRREAKSGKNIMGLAAMLADANMKGGAGISDLEYNVDNDAASAEGNVTTEDAIMKYNHHAEDTGQPNCLPPQVAGITGSNTTADGSPPTAAVSEPARPATWGGR